MLQVDLPNGTTVDLYTGMDNVIVEIAFERYVDGTPRRVLVAIKEAGFVLTKRDYLDGEPSTLYHFRKFGTRFYIRVELYHYSVRVFFVDSDTSMEPTTLTGLSTSVCFAQIARGQVNPDKVEEIISSTAINSFASLLSVARSYSGTFWIENPEKARRIFAEFWRAGKIRQPRLEGQDYPNISDGPWRVNTNIGYVQCTARELPDVFKVKE